MGKKNNSYTASYKLKMISFAEQFGNRAAQREFRILESNVHYWRKQKELLKNAKCDSRAFCGLKAGKSTYFTHPDFSAAKLEKKSAQITQVNTVIMEQHFSDDKHGKAWRASCLLVALSTTDLTQG
jgi:hypothetical protein